MDQRVGTCAYLCTYPCDTTMGFDLLKRCFSQVAETTQILPGMKHTIMPL